MRTALARPSRPAPTRPADADAAMGGNLPVPTGAIGRPGSRQVAAFLGPTLIVLAVSEAKNLSIWATGVPPLTYLAGLIWFLGGLTVVRLHNRWSAGWPVTITLVGWFLLVGGLFRMLFPDLQQGNQNTPALAAYATDAVLLGLGAVMTFEASRRSHRGPA